MSRFTRSLPFALGLGCIASVRAEEPPLPGIFAPRRVTAEVVTEPPAMLRRSGTSTRLSALIAERLLEKAQAFDLSTLPIVRRENAGDAVMLEKFVVKAEKVQPTLLPEPETPLRRFLRSGRVYEKDFGKVKMEVDLNLIFNTPPGALPKEEVIRAELRFQFKW